MNFILLNYSQCKVNAYLSASGSILAVDALPAGFPTSLTPTQQIPIILNDAATGLIFEIVYCTAISGNNLTITRGQENTIPLSWYLGDNIFIAPTAKSLLPRYGDPLSTLSCANGVLPTDATNLQQVKSFFAGQLLSCQVLSSSGNYNPLTNNPSHIIVEVIGSGGGGGGGSASASYAAGAGAGAGGYGLSLLTAAELGASLIPYTIGAGGAGGAIGTKGATGQLTGFGSFLTADGGGGGGGLGAVTGNYGGVGGNAFNGNLLNLIGENAQSSGLTFAGTNGASTKYGAGGSGAFSVGSLSVMPVNGVNGGGGGGGMSGVTGYEVGANGGNGLIIIWEYL